MRKTTENNTKTNGKNCGKQSDTKSVKNCGGKGCGKNSTKNCK